MEPKKYTGKIILYVLASFGALMITGSVYDSIKKEDNSTHYNPRNAVMGVDKVYTKDSIYTIKVSIQKVEAQDEKEDKNAQDYR